MARKFDVYGVGNAIIDLQLSVSESDIEKLKLEKGAMRLVDGDEQRKIFSYLGTRIEKQASGGSAANTMIAIAQLGGNVAYACTVGNDAFGEFYFEEMKQLGVSLHTKPLAGQQTGTCVILITPDAERTMNTNLGASIELTPQDLNESQVAHSTWVYIEGYLLAQENGRMVAEKAVEYAKKHNCRIAITFSDGFIVDFFREPLDQIVRVADLVFANLNEGGRFTGKSDEQEIFESLKSTVPNVVLTMGSRGVLCHYDEKSCQVPSFPVTAVDDTGAGDMFAGAFLYGVTHGWDGEQAARLGCFLASRVVSQLGPRLSGNLREIHQDIIVDKSFGNCA